MGGRAELVPRLVPAGAVTCAVALFNRFPLTYFDSGRYRTECYLDRACDARAYLLCADRNQLHRDSDWFLWDPAGPWRKYQRDPAFLAEAHAIVRGTLRQEWRRQAVASLRSALRQAGKFGTEPGWQRSEAEVAPALAAFGPSTVSAYWASAQGRRVLPLEAAVRRAGAQPARAGVAFVGERAVSKPGTRRRNSSLVAVDGSMDSGYVRGPKTEPR